jgi:hypothetical protein
MPEKMPNPLTRRVLGTLVLKYGWRHQQIARRTRITRTTVTLQLSGIRRIHTEHIRGYLRLPITDSEKESLRRAWLADNDLH